MLWFGIFLSLLITVSPTYSARILGIVSTTCYSHQSVYQPLWRKLSLRGHQVTVLTTDPVKDPSLINLTEIDCSFSYKTKHGKLNVNRLAGISATELMRMLIPMGYRVGEEQLQHPMVQNMLKNETEHYDVVLVEGFYNAGAAFAERFNCPLIQMLAFDAFQYHYHNMGNPSHPILNPDSFLPFVGKLNFFERLTSVILSFAITHSLGRLTDSQNLLVKKYFGANHPSLHETLSKTTTWFVNTDPVLHPIRPLLPTFVQIGGGIHIKSPKPLPKDLQKVLDNSSRGFIYFSLGTNVKSTLVHQERLAVLTETFTELPYTILWKFEEEDLPGKPENVIMSKWFPQQDVLRHPNIKLFITQGGIQSVEESMYSHVPMVGMPFIADQQFNMKRIVHLGMGLSLDFATMDKKTLKETILEVINNPQYRERAKELAELAKDQPMSGLERAVWWTEYVIRHKGAKHLRSPAIDLPSYQYFLLDVIGFCLVVVLVAICVLVRLVKLVYKIFILLRAKIKTD